MPYALTENIKNQINTYMNITKYLKTTAVFLAIMVSPQLSETALAFEYQGGEYSLESDYNRVVTLEDVPDKTLSGAFIIPEYVERNGYRYPVGRVKMNAFVGTGITELTIPTTTFYIYAADDQSYTLQRINIPNGEDLRIAGYISVNSVFLDRRVLEKEYGVANGGFKDVSEVVFGSNITSIRDGLFYMGEVNEVTIPANITSIDTEAFYNKVGTLNISRGAVVLSLYDNSFGGIDNLNLARNIRVSYHDPMSEQQDPRISVDNTLVVDDVMTELPTGITYYKIRHLILGKGISVLNPDGSFASLEEFSCTESLTEIGERAFYNNSVFKSIDLGKNISKIGEYAFGNCKNLKSVKLGDKIREIGLGAFSYSGLEEIDIPDGVTTIGQDAFSSCKNLKSVSIGTGLEPLSYFPFYDCSNLKTVYVKLPVPVDIPYNPNEYYRWDPKCRTLIVPFGAKSAYHRSNWSKYFNLITQEESAEALDIAISIDKAGDGINKVNLSDVAKIRKIKISGQINGTDLLLLNRMSNVEHIDLSDASIVAGGQAYYVDDNKSWNTTDNTLEQYWLNNVFPYSLKLPKVTTIGDHALYYKKGLVNVEIPPTVTRIGEYAFSECKDLESVLIGQTQGSIGRYAFEYCSSLKEITLHDGITSLGDYIFQNCSSLSRATLPNTITEIPQAAFCYTSLKDIDIPLSVEEIRPDAFRGTCLTSVTIPSNVKYINATAFCVCRSLSEVKLTEGLRSIGYGAFSNCALAEIEFPNTLTGIGGDAFGQTELTEATIPPSVTYIGSGAFLHLKKLTFEDGPEVLELGFGDRYNQCVSADTIYIGRQLNGEYVTTATITMPDVKSVTFGNYVTDINIAIDAPDITKIIIPASVKSIAKRVFYKTGLTDISVWNTTPPKIEEDTFSQDIYNNATLHVLPQAKTDYWLHPYWGKFFNILDDLKAESGISTPESRKALVRVAGGTIYVDGAGNDIFVRVVDSLGRTIYSGTDRSVSGLAPGLYIVDVDGQTTKVVI